MKTTRRSIWAAVGILTLAVWMLSLGLQQPQRAAAESKGLELAVYNQDLALVLDRRALDLDQGVNEVRFQDVAALIDPTSVHLRSVTDPDGTAVLEQNFEYDVVGSAKLLQKYLDREIRLVTNDGQEYAGKLLSGDSDVILEAEDGQVTVVRIDQIKQFSFPALPEGLITRPTLVWQLEAAQDGSQDVEVSYLTGGVNWYASYVVVLADDDKSVDLDGWVTLDNRSGTTYKNAKLKLIAGDINRVASDGYARGKMAEMEAPLPAVDQVAERGFFEYHLYEVQRPVTVKDQQTKQIEFVTGRDVPASKFFVYDATQMSFWGYDQPVSDPGYGITSNKKVMVMVELQNREQEGLGLPLPKGTVRVFKKDVDGSSLLVGEDAIDHTPKDEQVRLYVGDAFDVVGERVQSDFQADYDDTWMEESFEITLRNHKAEDIEVRIVEHLYRWSEWTILEESQESVKKDAQTIEYRVPVKADGEATVTYRVRYEW